MQLKSYVQSRWAAGESEGLALRNATTGAVVATSSSAGIDFGAVLRHAREVGGSALRRMTFHQRAALLKALAKHLSEYKTEFYALSTATGATQADSWIDIDGGIATLFVYAGKGVRELPNQHAYIDGRPEAISKGGSFIGQHVCVPLEGAAIHINAFNFPVWGMLEKLAPTILAGMPVIVKPATSTSYLTALVFRRMIDADIFPPGALQLICGSLGDSFDHLGCQDVVSFTGSASTALGLRRHPVVMANAVRFVAETDSINASILGDDVRPGMPEFDLYVREVVREMTVKAGQKCTAIRKAIVPAGIAGEVSEAIAAALRKIVVGDPALEQVRMGPLASLAQRREVLERVGRLREEAELVLGAENFGAAGSGGGVAGAGGSANGADWRAVDMDGRAGAANGNGMKLVGASAELGAFVAPMLLLCPRPMSAAAVHTTEAFGPVCTLMPYTDTSQAIELARRGEGSLAASIFSADDAIACELALGIAPYHGRIVIINRHCAKESTGHGSPLPHLVHGGPGRAGGGEEMGGIRGVMHYMQRTALQGSPQTLSIITGRWQRGAVVRDPGRHPFRKSFHELEIGDGFTSEWREITLEDIERFAALSGDHFYAHMNQAEAERNPLFGGRVAHGYFLVSAAAGLFVDPAYGPVLANYGIDELRFIKPVKPGDRIRVSITCKQKTLRADKGYGEVAWDVQIVNQDNEPVANYDVLTMVSESGVPN